MRGSCFAARVLKCVVSFVLVTGPVLADAAPAFASQVSEQSSAEAPDSKPTVVAEEVDLRSATSRTFRMSDGTFRREVYTGPLNYKDASGKWQPIDTTLEVGSAPGEHVSAKAQVKASFRGTGDPRYPVRVERDGVAIELDMLGGQEGLHLASGNEARYLEVATDTDLLYECNRGGVKETITLSSPAAPDTFTFRMAVTSGHLGQDEAGNWALYAKEGDAEPALTMGDIAVWDASGARAQVGADASMTVLPDASGAYVTYSVSRTWLSDLARTYPVSIDPSFYVSNDCYVSEQYPTTKYGGATSLQAGRPDGASNHDNRALFRFSRSTLGIAGAYIRAGDFQVYANDVDPICPTAHLGTSNYWAPSPSWNTRPGPEPVTAGWIANKTLSDNAWSYWDITDTVAGWADPAYGSSWCNLQLYQKEDGSEAARFHKQYDSNESARRPKVNLTYVIPSVSVSVPKSSYVADGADTVVVSATATANGYPSDIRRFEIQVNGTSADPNRKRGLITWFSTDPGEGWVSQPAAGGGYFAYRTSDATYTTPLLDQCATSLTGSGRTFTFKLNVKEGWGDIQSNRIDYQLSMDPTGWEDPNYVSGWKTGSGLFNVLPCTPQGLTATADGLSWFTEPDANGDGIADSGCDVADQGRGVANLAWSANGSANGFKVYLSDGKTFRQVATATGAGVASWDSAGLDIYPTDSAIAALPDGYSGNPFTSSGSGLDLRDDPNPLYRKTASAEDTRTHYEFRVVPYNSGGDGAPADVAIQLPNRTNGANDDAQHTTYDLGEVARHAAHVELDSGTLALDVTDLAIASWGPEAALTRHYASDDRTSALFTPGWRFNFEAAIETATATYVDQTGERHRFVIRDGEFAAPRGYHATLTTSAVEPYRLTFTGRDYMVFDAGGVLLREGDRNGNEVTYTRPDADFLAIEAANGQAIDVAFDGGEVSSATYATADGTRTVTYDTSDMTAGHGWMAEVSYFPNTADAHRVRYDYDSGGETPCLLALDVPYLPSHEYSTSDINMAFEYYDAQLKVTDWTVGALAGGGIEYGGNTATVGNLGKVVGENGLYGQMGPWQEFTWRPSGATSVKSNPYAFDDPVRNWTYEYGPGGEVVGQVSPLGAESTWVCDTRGNMIRAQDPDGGATTYAYDANSNLVVETDPRGSVTQRSYDASGNLTTEERVLDTSGTRSHKEWDYDEATGLVTREEAKVSETETAVTTYGEFGPSGEPGETSQLAVKLSSSGAAQTLTEEVTFDDFGAVLTRTNAAGETVETNSYSVSGRLTASTDLAGVTTVSEYDGLGRVTSSYREKGGATVERTDFAVDARDQVTLEEHYLGENPSFTIEHTIDGLGRELEVEHSIAGTTTYMHDPAGNVVFEWDPDATIRTFFDVDDLTDAERCQSTRHVFDVDGHETRTTAEGQMEASSTVSNFSAGGRVTKTTQPDGSWTGYGYDAAGNQTSETRPHETSGEVSDVSVYDLGGRLTESIKAAGTAEQAVTTHAYDLLDREVSSALGEASTKTYNRAGWVLSETDAAGIVTERTYDAASRSTAESVGGKTTTFAYEDGQLSRKTDPTGRYITYAYDGFGRVCDEAHFEPDDDLIKRTETAYDALSRAVATTQSPAGVTSEFAYAAGSTKTSSATLRTDESSTTIAYDEQGRETNRQILRFRSDTHSRSVTSRDGEDRALAWSTDGHGSTASYDAAGKLVSQAGFGWASSSSGAAYGYDAETGRKTAEAVSLADASGDYTAGYEYSEAGRLAAVAGSQAWTYGFDEAGNLTSAQQSGQTARSFLYDADTNQLTTKKTGAAVDTVYGFDSLGRRHTQGPQADTSRITYTWDDDSRLTGYSDTSRDLSATFTYDADGQRTSAVFQEGGDTTSFWYVYDGIQLLSVKAAETGSISTTCTIDYLYEETGRPFAATYRGTAAVSSGELFHLVTTDRGDVVEALNSGGTPVATYKYDAWGNPTGSTASSDPVASRFARLQPLRYAGYAFDSITGLHYLSARYYDPATYQFISKDPAKADGEESAYQYCGGDPVGYVDPSGEIKIRKDESYYIHDWGGRWRYWFAQGYEKRITEKKTVRVGGRGFYHEFRVPKWARNKTIHVRVEVYRRCLKLYEQYSIYEKKKNSRGKTYWKLVDRHYAGRARKTKIWDYKYVLKFLGKKKTFYSFKRTARSWGY